jgi:hypothetical protein
METKTIKRVKVNAVVQWAYLNKQNDMSGKYQVDLCNLSEAAVDALEDIGISVKKKADKPEKGYYITCTSQNPIKAFDSNGALIPEDTSVGNGSKTVAVITPYSWTFKGKAGISPSLASFVITDLVEFKVDTSDDGAL